MQQEKEPTLGQKIEMFRKRAGISQFQLELDLGISFGTLSRIESGAVNPTKETIIKIIDSLNLSVYDASVLFDLNEKYDLGKLVSIARKVSSSLDINQVLQNAVNEIALELKLLASFITIVKENNRVYSITFTQTWFSKLAKEIIGVPFDSLYVSLDKDLENFIVKTIKNREILVSNTLSDFTTPFVSKTISDILQRICTAKTCISIPIIVEETCIGAIVFGKDYIDDFSHELPILKAFAEHVGTAILNSQKHENLKLEISKIHKNLQSS